MTQPRPELARDLNLSHAGAVVVGTIIGSGIFLVPSEMMQAVGSARLVYLAWMVGGLGATEVSPLAEEHGRLLGRIDDPFGHRGEIGQPLGTWPPSEGGKGS